MIMTFTIKFITKLITLLSISHAQCSKIHQIHQLLVPQYFPRQIQELSCQSLKLCLSLEAIEP